MDAKQLLQLIEAFSEQSPLNVVTSEQALSPEMTGLRMYEAPLVGFAAADDPGFLALKETNEAIGPHFMLPDFWLPGAKTVLSLFFPFTARVKESNRDGEKPSLEWYQARIEGHRFVAAACEYIKEILAADGFAAIIPSQDSRFASSSPKKAIEGFPETLGQFTCNWSERHVAYVCGLGTFGLSRGLLTAKGVAGRIGSVVTDLSLPATPKTYDEPFAHCTLCGACAANCPAAAIDMEKGIAKAKDNPLCSDFLGTTRLPTGHYGCGKCQVLVPCESGFPQAEAQA